MTCQPVWSAKRGQAAGLRRAALCDIGPPPAPASSETVGASLPFGSPAIERLGAQTLTAAGGVWRDTDVAKRSAYEVARRTPPTATRDAARYPRTLPLATTSNAEVLFGPYLGHTP